MADVQGRASDFVLPTAAAAELLAAMQMFLDRGRIAKPGELRPLPADTRPLVARPGSAWVRRLWALAAIAAATATVGWAAGQEGLAWFAGVAAAFAAARAIGASVEAAGRLKLVPAEAPEEAAMPARPPDDAGPRWLPLGAHAILAALLGLAGWKLIAAPPAREEIAVTIKPAPATTSVRPAAPKAEKVSPAAASAEAWAADPTSKAHRIKAAQLVCELRLREAWKPAEQRDVYRLGDSAWLAVSLQPAPAAKTKAVPMPLAAAAAEATARLEKILGAPLQRREQALLTAGQDGAVAWAGQREWAEIRGEMDIDGVSQIVTQRVASRAEGVTAVAFGVRPEDRAALADAGREALEGVRVTPLRESELRAVAGLRLNERPRVYPRLVTGGEVTLGEGWRQSGKSSRSFSAGAGTQAMFLSTPLPFPNNIFRNRPYADAMLRRMKVAFTPPAGSAPPGFAIESRQDIRAGDIEWHAVRYRRMENDRPRQETIFFRAIPDQGWAVLVTTEFESPEAHDAVAQSIIKGVKFGYLWK